MPWEQSLTGRLVARVLGSLQTVHRGSVLASWYRAFRSRSWAVIRGSVCYRWLTTAPETETTTIDLRETRTLGPLFETLTMAVHPLERAWRSSNSAVWAALLGEAVSNSRVSALLRTLLTPPEQVAVEADDAPARATSEDSNAGE